MNKPLRFLCLSLAGSCIHYTSPPPEASPAARKVHGDSGYVRLRDGAEASGELIEVRDSSLMLLDATRLMLVPFSEIARAEFGSQFRTERLSSGSSKITLEYGRSASRFPLGLTAPARDAILEGLRKTAVDTLRAVRR